MYGQYDSETLEKVHRAQMIIFQDFADLCERHDLDYFAIAGTAIGAVRHQGFIPWDDDIDVAMLRPDFERFVEYAEEELDDKYYLMGPSLNRHFYNLRTSLVRKGTVFVEDVAWAGGYRPGLSLDLFIYDNVPEDPALARRQAAKCRFWNALCFARNTHLMRIIDGQHSLTGKAKYVISGVLGTVLRAVPGTREWIFRRAEVTIEAYRGATHRYSAVYDPGATFMYVNEDEIYPLVDMPFENTTVKMLHDWPKQLARHMGNDYMTLPPEEKRTNHYPRELDFGTMLD